MVQEGYPGMKRFQPIPGTGRNNDSSYRRRRALAVGTDSDGWIDVNDDRHQRFPPVRGTARSPGKISRWNDQEISANNATNGSADSDEVSTATSGHSSPGRVGRGYPQLHTLPCVIPGGYNNWTLSRVYSEELYSVLEKHNNFGGKYLSAAVLAEIFHEKMGKHDFSVEKFFLGVEVTKVNELMRYGQTGIRLSIKGLVLPRAREYSSMEDVTLTANQELAELLKMVLQPGDIVEIFGDHLQNSQVIHLNINMSGNISIVHYRHCEVFSPIKGSGLTDVYNQIQDSRFLITKHMDSDTEHRVVIKPSCSANEVLAGATKENALQLASVVCSRNLNTVADVTEHKQPSQSDLESQTRNSQSVNDATLAGVGANVLCIDEFEQSNTSSSGKTTGNPNSNPSQPCSCDSTDYVMQALFPEDNPNSNPASQPNSSPCVNDARGVVDDDILSEMQVDVDVPENNLAPSMPPEEEDDVFGDLEDSQEMVSPENSVLLRENCESSRALISTDNFNENDTKRTGDGPERPLNHRLQGNNGMEEKNPVTVLESQEAFEESFEVNSPRREQLYKPEVADARAGSTLQSSKEQHSKVHGPLREEAVQESNNVGKDANTSLEYNNSCPLKEPQRGGAGNNEDEFVDAMENPDDNYDTVGAIYMYLDKDTQDYQTKEPENKLADEEKYKDKSHPVDGNNLEASNINEMEVQEDVDHVPVPQTQYFDEVGNPTPPPEKPIPASPEPAEDPLPAKSPTNRKQKKKKKKKHQPILKHK